MNIKTYQELSSRTLNENVVIATPKQLQLCNYALGLVGEAGELLELAKVDEMAESDNKILEAKWWMSWGMYFGTLRLFILLWGWICLMRGLHGDRFL